MDDAAVTAALAKTRPLGGNKIVRGHDSFKVVSNNGDTLFEYKGDHELNINEIRLKAEEMYKEYEESSAKLEKEKSEGFFDGIINKIKSFFSD